MQRIRGKCDVCGQEAELDKYLYYQDDDKMVCDDCYAKEELRAEYWYEVLREEGVSGSNA